MIETLNSPQQPTSEARQHSEGRVARTIEAQTAKLPSDVFLWSALGSMGASLVLRLTGKKDESQFIGQWAAPLLILGLYNKVVKVAGSDRVHSRESES
jgi:hypothetical protein